MVKPIALTRRMLLALLAASALHVHPAPAAAAAGTIDTFGLQALLANGEDSVFLLDVRTPGEFARGRISGSVPIPMNQVPQRLDQIPKDRKVVVVCATGARSGAVARYLSDNGYPQVVNYAGGLSAWARQGLEIER